MTCEAGKQGEGTAPAVPRPGSVTNAAMRALIEFAKAERVIGAAVQAETFDGILAEHALALEEARDKLSELLELSLVPWKSKIQAAYDIVDEQIRYVRALGSVAGPATDQEDETDG